MHDIRSIVNGDPPHVYRNLIAPDTARSGRTPRSTSSSTRWASSSSTSARPASTPTSPTTRSSSARRTSELLKKLFDDKEVEREDLSVYLHRPTATDPSMAPDGMDSFYVLVPVPNLQPVRGRGRTMRAPSVSEGSDPNAGTPSSRSGLASDEVPLHDDGSVDWSKLRRHLPRRRRSLPRTHGPARTLRLHHRRLLRHARPLPRQPQHPPRHRLLRPADLPAIRLVPLPQQERHRRPLLRRRGHPPGCGHAGRAVQCQTRRQPHRARRRQGVTRR